MEKPETLTNFLSEVYEISSEIIGMGTSGKVVAVFRKADKKPFALKVFQKEKFKEDEYDSIKKQIKKELGILRKVYHSGGLKVQDYSDSEWPI